MYIIYRTFSSMYYWIGVGDVVKCDLFHSRSHRKLTFHPGIIRRKLAAAAENTVQDNDHQEMLEGSAEDGEAALLQK